MESDIPTDRIVVAGRYPLYPKLQPVYRIEVTLKRITCTPCDPMPTSSTTSCDGVPSTPAATSTDVLNASIDRHHDIRRSSTFSEKITRSRDKTRLLHFSDITGCECQKSEKSQSVQKSLNAHSSPHVEADGVVAYLCIYAYPRQSRLLGKTEIRKRHTLIITFNTQRSFGENFAEALHWQQIINCLANKHCIHDMRADINDWTYVDKRRFLVLINPASGPGKAVQLFKHRVQPMLAEASINHHVIVTKRAGECEEIVRSLNLDEWYGIVIVSGDGLVYELINGLMSRRDWHEAMQMPFSVLPAGSGNALCTALLAAAKEPHVDNLLTHATFMLLKHVVTPMDLMSVDTSGGHRLFSFLHVAWGLVSDVDIESEKFRRLGNARFTVGAIIRIANLRKYRGRLSFLPVDPNYKSKFITSTTRKFQHHLPTNENSSNNGNSQCEPSLQIHNQSDLNQNSNFNIGTNCNADVNHETNINNSNPTGACNENKTHDKVSHNTSNRLNEPLNHDINGNGNAFELPRRRYLPDSLDAPLPDSDGWVTIEDDFVSLVASLQTHAAQDFVVAPTARVNDGCIHLLWARHGLGRLDMVRMLSEMEKGRLDANEWVELVPVRAFRLVPLSNGRILTVDGERVEYGPIQAEVIPSAARVMSHPMS